MPKHTTVLETLESRRLMAAKVGVSDGVLKITGDNGYDTAVVAKTNATGEVRVTYFNGYRTVESTFTAKYGIGEIVFNAGNGGSEFINNTSLPSTALGGAGADWFYGGSKTDVFYGLRDADYLSGGGGADRLYGGEGNDEPQGRHGPRLPLW